MKSYRLLLPNTILPAAERMFVTLRSELSVVDPSPIWRKQSRRLVQIDLPDFHSRVLEEVARRKGLAVEVLLQSWIEAYQAEIEGRASGSPRLLPSTPVQTKLKAIADWADLGYTGREDVPQELVFRLLKD
jgi:hypothetical protein